MNRQQAELSVVWLIVIPVICFGFWYAVVWGTWKLAEMIA